MIFIGEKINGMFSSVRKAIDERDSKFILKLAESQLEAGAKYLDVNVGASDTQEEDMKWIVTELHQLPEVQLAIDTPNPSVMETGLKLCKNRPILNSTSAETEKSTNMLPLAAKYGAQLIALTIGDSGIPSGAEERVALAAAIITAANDYGIKTEDVYIDPVLLPIRAAQGNPLEVLQAIPFIKELDIPAPKTVVGLSNISQRCKSRSLINRAFLAIAIYVGLDAAIADVLDVELTQLTAATKIALNQDIYCDSFLHGINKLNK